MDNAQIVSEIRNRVGQNSGLSDLTISSLITPIIPTDGEPTEEFYNNTANWLKTLGGNFSHDVAQQVTSQVEAKANEKLEAFKKEYKPQVKSIEDIYKLLGVDKPADNAPKSIDDLIAKLQTPQQPQPQPNQQNEILTELLKTIREGQKPDPAVAEMQKQLKELIDENNRIKNQAAFDEIVKTVTDKADELRVLDTALWNHSIEMVTLGADRNGLTADKLLELTKSKYEALTKALRPANAKPYGESQSGGGGNSLLNSVLAKKDAAREARLKAMEAQRKNWK